MSTDNKVIIRKLIEEVWNQKKPGLIDELIASNYVNHNPEGVLNGIKGYHQFYQIYTKAFPDCKVQIIDLIATENVVVFQYVFKGTHKGELMGIAPTGNQVSVKGITIIRLENGKVWEEKIVWDTLRLMEQLDAVPHLHH